MNFINWNFDLAYCFWKKHNLELLSDYYRNNRIPYLTKCLKCNHEWEICLYSIQQGSGCPKCAGNLRFNEKQIKQIYLEHNLEFIDDTNYRNNKTPYLTKCLKCNHEWKIRLHDIRQKNGCPKCAKNFKLTFEQAQQICLEQKIVLNTNEIKNVKIYYYAKCLKCNHGQNNEWKTCINNIKNKKGCPNCSKCKNEKLTGEFLKELFPNIEIKPKTFFVEIFDENSIKIRDKIIVDYFFELNNQEYIIEYNGDQHYKPIQFGNISIEKAINNFVSQQIRDNFLRNFCEENKIRLIEIDGRKYKDDKIKKILENLIINNMGMN